MRYSTSRRRRLSVPLVLSLLGAGFFVGGCSESGSASQPADAPIKIQNSQMYITVRNDTAIAIDDVGVAIVPMARTTVFDKNIGRLESGQTREIMLGDFTGRDGTPFSLRAIKPRSVQAKGADINGKTYNVEVDWK